MGLLSNIGTAIKTGVLHSIDQVFGYSQPADLNNQTGKQVLVQGSGLPNLKAGFESAVIAVPATKALELPGVAAKLATGAKAAVGAVATSLKGVVKNNPIKSIVIGTAAAGYVASNPQQAVSDAYTGVNKLIPDLYNVGSNISQFRADPTIANAKTTLLDNPLIVGGGLAVLGLGVTKAVVGATGVFNGINQGEYTPKPQVETIIPVPENVVPKTDVVKETPTNNGQIIPVTPETQVLGTPAGNTTVTKKKTSKKSVLPSININIVNQSRLQSVKYLNARYY